MECNKDEATRAKEIAERKFNARDTLGAKKFALKAQNLFPSLEGIPQLIATLDVYISAENKINGEADWYGILGVNPRADDDTVRKQYRKLALMLHPDKNKSVGADEAFKLISEAWSLLSDKARRAAYDEKRNIKARKNSTKFGGSSTQTGANGSYNFTKPAPKPSPSTASKPKNAAKEHPSSSTYKSKSNTFWTVCTRCKMQYEYLRVYLNLKLLCPNCNEAFYAKETAPPPASGIRPATSFSFSKNQHRQVPNKSKPNAGKNNMAAPNFGAGSYSKTDPYNKTGFQWAPFSKTSGVSNVAQAASVVQQAYDKVKRDREEAQAATKREEALKRKQHASKKGYYNPAKRRKGGMEDASVGGKAYFDNNRESAINQANGSRDLSPGELHNILMEKARKEISQKLGEIRSNTVDKTAVEGSGNDFQKADEEGEKSFQNSETFAGTAIARIGSKILEAMPVDVPDADFYDFYKVQTEKSFGKNQIWAVYNDDDGMPRSYVMIHNVISLNPFKIEISWLYPNTNYELGHLNLVASGLSKACGNFRAGRHEIYNSTHFFSHKVRWSKGNDGAISIYPSKGEVWAIYRNWSRDWNELTADEVIHKLDMVEVLEDFIEERGVTVIPLVKVAGFKTLFHDHLDPREIRIIPREEMSRFSHQVPSYLLTGLEAPNAPKGCRVLDPAATPSELLEVIKVLKLEDVVDDEDRFVTETSKYMKEADGEEMINDMKEHGKEKEGENKDIQQIKTLKEDKGKEVCTGL